MRFTRAGRVSLAAGSLAVALAAAACSGSSAGTSSATTAAHLEKTNIVVGALPVVDTAGLYLAEKEGYFRQAGLNVTIVPITASPLAIPTMEQGKVDIVAGANYVSFLQAQAAGKHFKILVDETACAAPTPSRSSRRRARTSRRRPAWRARGSPSTCSTTSRPC